MKQIKRIIGLSYESGLSLREISGALCIPRSTISDYLKRFRQSGLSLSDLEEKDSEELYRHLFPEKPEREQSSLKPVPDFARIHQELKRKHVTRMLLWEEYREANRGGYGYSQFCELYNQWKGKLHISMRQVHRAGEKMFVDYSGLKMEIIDPQSGVAREVDIFVAALGASGYTYAEASPDQTRASFISSHVNTFEYFGGVTEIIVPDNLKSGVTKADRYEPHLNETYRDMAEHYGAVIIPARPYRPKDKPKAELSVKLVQRWILARLRHRQFFSVEELNAAIRELLPSFNHRLIKKFGKSRYELYLELDRPALKPLPAQAYILREFKFTRVNIDYHVEVEGSYYSVPYQLIDKEVEVCYSKTSVEVYDNNKRIALHRRLHQAGAYSTCKEHMSAAHRAYAEYSPSRVIEWGARFGEKTKELMETILKKRPHPQMGFRSCLGILRATRHVEKEVVEAISARMLKLESFRVTHFKSILKNKTYLPPQPDAANTPDSIHENVRGNTYYC